MVCRIWHGWTTSEHAPAFEKLLRSAVFAPRPDGSTIHPATRVLRREAGASVEFISMIFEESVEALEHHGAALDGRSGIPPEAIPLLSRHDLRATIHHVLDTRAPGAL